MKGGLRALLGVWLALGAVWPDARAAEPTPVLSTPTAAKAVTIAVFDGPEGSDHERKVMGVLREALKGCPRCQVKSYPLYEADGTLRAGTALRAIEQGAPSADILHFSWNLGATDKARPLVEALSRWAKQGKIVIGAAGENEQGRHRIRKLSETVMGQVPGALIVGELTEKGHLAPRSQFGPELFTALLPASGLRGSSFSAPLLSAAVARALQSASAPEVRARLYRNRANSVSLYPGLDELLP